MRSFKIKPDERRMVYLALAGSVESQLRDAYAKRHEIDGETQVSLADKVDLGRSTINKRLTGQTNMTLKTIADMVWALGHGIKVDIFDPADRPDINYPLAPSVSPDPTANVPDAFTTTVSSSSNIVHSRVETGN